MSSLSLHSLSLSLDISVTVVSLTLLSLILSLSPSVSLILITRSLFAHSFCDQSLMWLRLSHLPPPSLFLFLIAHWFCVCLSLTCVFSLSHTLSHSICHSFSLSLTHSHTHPRHSFSLLPSFSFSDTVEVSYGRISYAHLERSGHQAAAYRLPTRDMSRAMDHQ